MGIRLYSLLLVLGLSACCSEAQKRNYEDLKETFLQYVEADEKKKESVRLFLETLPEESRKLNWIIQYRGLESWGNRIEKAKETVNKEVEND